MRGSDAELTQLAETHEISNFDLTPDDDPLYTRYRDGSFELFRGEERLTSTNRDLRYPTWLEERETVLALADKGGSELFDFVEIDPTTGRVTPMLEDEHRNMSPVQSPTDSNTIAFISTRDHSFDLYTLNAESGDISRAVDCDRPVASFDWAPDGTALVYQVGMQDNTYLEIAEDGESEELLDLGDSEERLGVFQQSAGADFWNESGILFASNTEGHLDVGCVQPDGTHEWLLTSDRDTTPAGWAPDGERFAYLEDHPGDKLVGVSDGTETRRVTERGYAVSVAWDTDGSPVCLRWDYDHGGELVREGTTLAREHVVEVPLTDPEVVRYGSFDGTEIPALCYEGQGDTALVYAHGGPEYRNTRIVRPGIQYLNRQGHTVLAPDFRGSTGYGRAYRKASDGDLGGDDVRDLEAAADYLRARGHDSVGVFGLSYGGYLSLMSVVKTDAFDACVDISGLANLHTMVERTEGWLRAYLIRKLGGSPEEKPSLYDGRSPVARADEINDPLLVVQGANDPRVPAEEAEQIVEALEERAVPNEYLLYDDEGHLIKGVENRIDMYEQMARFFDRHLGQ